MRDRRHASTGVVLGATLFACALFARLVAPALLSRYLALDIPLPALTGLLLRFLPALQLGPPVLAAALFCAWRLGALRGCRPAHAVALTVVLAAALGMGILLVMLPMLALKGSCAGRP